MRAFSAAEKCSTPRPSPLEPTSTTTPIASQTIDPRLPTRIFTPKNPDIDATRKNYTYPAPGRPWRLSLRIDLDCRGSPDGVRSANERPVTSFSYVYDCGSERSDAFNSEMSLYPAACDGKTDVLFVSHLHADHINGIDRLQAMEPAKTVIVPYLDAVERCFSCFPILSAVRYPVVARLL